jgi:hypothetical protein
MGGSASQAPGGAACAGGVSQSGGAGGAACAAGVSQSGGAGGAACAAGVSQSGGTGGAARQADGTGGTHARRRELSPRPRGAVWRAQRGNDAGASRA